MNKVHSSIITHIRLSSGLAGGKIADTISNLTDSALVRMMFSNYRGTEDRARGLRLTTFGLTVMQSYFQYFDIPMPEGHQMQISEILYLDRRAILPYFFSNDKAIVFETELGIKLKLADGNIATLIQIEAA